MHQTLGKVRTALLLAATLFMVGFAAEVATGKYSGAGKREVGYCGQASLRHAVLCLINHERAERGLQPLRLNERMSVAAVRHSRHMVEARYFSHTTPAGVTFDERIRRAGVHKRAVGEVLAWGGAPRSVVGNWMCSPDHRWTILRPFFWDVGIGITRGTPTGAQGRTYTVDLGTRG